MEETMWKNFESKNAKRPSILQRSFGEYLHRYIFTYIHIYTDDAIEFKHLARGSTIEQAPLKSSTGARCLLESDESF